MKFVHFYTTFLSEIWRKKIGVKKIKKLGAKKWISFGKKLVPVSTN